MGYVPGLHVVSEREWRKRGCNSCQDAPARLAMPFSSRLEAWPTRLVRQSNALGRVSRQHEHGATAVVQKAEDTAKQATRHGEGVCVASVQLITLTRCCSNCLWPSPAAGTSAHADGGRASTPHFGDRGPRMRQHLASASQHQDMMNSTYMNVLGVGHSWRMPWRRGVGQEARTWVPSLDRSTSKLQTVSCSALPGRHC